MFCWERRVEMTEVNRITLNWAMSHTGVYGTLHRPFPAKPTGSAFPYFYFPQTTQCSSERHPKLWWGAVFVWHREQDRSLASLVQLLRGTQTSPRETGWSQSRHGKGGQAPEWAGRWGGPYPWMSKEWLDMVLVENGIDPKLDSMLWEVFSKLDDSGTLLSGMERAGTWIWAAQRGTALPAMGHSLFPGISAK